MRLHNLKGRDFVISIIQIVLNYPEKIRNKKSVFLRRCIKSPPIFVGKNFSIFYIFLDFKLSISSPYPLDSGEI